MELAAPLSLLALLLAAPFWLVALGGLGDLSASACRDMLDATARPALARAQCSQMFGWQFWVLFFELFLLAAALLATLTGRLKAFRAALTPLLAIATAWMAMAAHATLGSNVWPDANEMLAGGDRFFPRGARRSYHSGNALEAGWIVMVICNMVWLVAANLVGDGDGDAAPAGLGAWGAELKALPGKLGGAFGRGGGGGAKRAAEAPAADVEA